MILASFSLISSIIGYIVSFKISNAWLSYGIFLLFTVTVSLLILTTGGADSPFVALFLLVAFFSGIFSYFGSLPILIAIGIYVGAYYVANNGLNFPFTMTLIFSAILPLLAGFIVWFGRETGENTIGRAHD